MIEGVFYIESQGKDKEAVKKSLHDLVDKLKREQGAKVRKAAFEKMIVDEDNCSSTVDVEVEFQTMKDYLMAAMKYGPSAITLDSPEKIEMTREEFLSLAAEVTAFTKMVFTKYGITFNVPQTEGSAQVGLDEEEIEGLLDQGAIRAKIVVELKDEEGIEERFLNVISKEIFLHKVKSTRLDDKILLAIHAFIYEPRTVMDISVTYTPVLIEIMEPEQIRLTLFDIQDMGVWLAATYFEVAHHALSMASPS